MLSVLTRLFGNPKNDSFGQAWLEVFCDRYHKAAENSPGLPPVDYLIGMWVGHFSCKSQKNAHFLIDQVVHQIACLHACVPPPKCCLALGLYMLIIEQPEFVQMHPHYAEHYAKLMKDIAPLIERADFNQLNALFDKYNPNVSKRSPLPIGGMESFERGRKLGLW